MATQNRPEKVTYLDKFTSRKDRETSDAFRHLPDSLVTWVSSYLQLAISGVRSEAVMRKIKLHLERFTEFYGHLYGHTRVSTLVKRDVVRWQTYLREDLGLAPATVNNHMASLSAFTSWVCVQAPKLFPVGDPAKGVGELALPPLEPRALSPDQVRSLKNICDRLGRFHQLKGRRHSSGTNDIPMRATGRPLRDRAIVFVLLSTGLRREELIHLDLEQVEPGAPTELRKARKARLARVKGKGKTERAVFLSADAREALADYLEYERPLDSDSGVAALFLSARGLSARAQDGRLSVRSINAILEQIGLWHDAEVQDPNRKISPLRPHDLRHTFAFQLSKSTGADAYELERRLGHRSQRYIQRYTNPPEAVAAKYVEDF